jgi:hypothetical protein
VTKLLLAAMLLLLALPAQAGVKAGPNVMPGGHHRLRTPGILDSFATPTGAYSFRRLRTAYTGPAIRLRRASDNTELDIGFTAGGDLDVPAATTHCAATSCFGVTWYDQSGDGHHATQMATPAWQPQFVFNCQGVLPCLRTASTGSLATATTQTVVGPVSISTVAIRNAGVGNCWGAFWDQNELRATAANTWGVTGTGAPEIVASAVDGAWHAITGVLNDAASVLRVDATETTGTVAPDAGTASLQTAVVSAAGTTCSFGETIVWSGYALNAPARALLAANQAAYWTPSPLDTLAPAAGAYSFRRLRTAYAGPAVKLRRVSDSGMLDIGFIANGDFDTAAAAAHCPTACQIATWYDQSGNARDMPATGGEPALVFSCQNGLPCMRTTASGPSLQSASVAWAAAKTSFSVVANRSAGTGQCFLAVKSANVLRTDTAGNWGLTDFTAGAMTAAATDAVWHAGIGIIDGTNSLMRIDATETPAGGSVPGVATAGVMGASYGAAATTCNQVEMIAWDNYALTAPERSALIANQKAYWQLPPPLVLDTLPASAAAYSFRKLRNAYAGPAVKLRRTSGGTQDIGFTGNDFDTAAAMTFCAATTCFVDTRYDQSGNSRHASQTNPAAQPQLVFNCIGTLPCASSTAGQFMQAPDVTPGASSASFSVVLRVAAAGGLCYGIQAASQLLGINGASLVLYNGASIAQAVSAAVWHSGVGVIAGAGSVVGVDGVETTGSITAVTTPGPTYELYNGAAPVCSYTEAVWWDNVALTAPQRTVLQTNQKSFWGTP